MRNTTLHATIEIFASEAAMQLTAETSAGAEIPFELVDTAGGHAAGSALLLPPTHRDVHPRAVGSAGRHADLRPGARALGGLDGVEAYLRQRGETRIPGERRECADAALRMFLSACSPNAPSLDLTRPVRSRYAELERALYEGRAVTTVAAPVLGIALDPVRTSLRSETGCR